MHPNPCDIATSPAGTLYKSALTPPSLRARLTSFRLVLSSDQHHGWPLPGRHVPPAGSWTSLRRLPGGVRNHVAQLGRREPRLDTRSLAEPAAAAAAAGRARPACAPPSGAPASPVPVSASAVTAAARPRQPGPPAPAEPPTLTAAPVPAGASLSAAPVAPNRGAAAAARAAASRSSSAASSSGSGARPCCRRLLHPSH